jgi:hypothetical protein
VRQPITARQPGDDLDLQSCGLGIVEHWATRQMSGPVRGSDRYAGTTLHAGLAGREPGGRL